MREHEQQFKNHNIGLAAIGLGDRNYARMCREDAGIGFLLLIDEERAAYRAVGLKEANIFHLFRSENVTARKRARSGGHKQHKLGKNPFQLGGSFVFAPGNEDLFAHVSATFGDNARIEDLLAAAQR